MNRGFMRESGWCARRLSACGWILAWAILVGAQPKSRLEFVVSFDQQTYQRADPINATLRLVNKSGSPVWVNKRFYLRGEDAPPKKRDVFLRITSPSGKPLTCKYNYDTGFPKSDYFEQLKPGQEAVAEYPRNLRGYFEFNEPGAYTLVGVYQNAFGDELGLPVFQGPLTSPSVSFTIAQ